MKAQNLPATARGSDHGSLVPATTGREGVRGSGERATNENQRPAVLLAALEEGAEVGLLAGERHDRARRRRRAYSKLAGLASAERNQQTDQTSRWPEGASKLTCT